VVEDGPPEQVFNAPGMNARVNSSTVYSISERGNHGLPI
jgi:hypothetical protein